MEDHISSNSLRDLSLKAYRSIAAVIIVSLIGEATSNLVVHLLVVLLGGDEVLGADGITALQVEVCTSTTGNSETSPEESVAGLGLTSLGSVTATSRSTEGLGRKSETSAADRRSDGRSRAEEGPGSGSRS